MREFRLVARIAHIFLKGVKMRNLCMVCAICAFLGVAVNAQENNGVFVGLEIGASEQQMKLKTPPNVYSTTHFGTIGRINLT